MQSFNYCVASIDQRKYCFLLLSLSFFLITHKQITQELRNRFCIVVCSLKSKNKLRRGQNLSSPSLPHPSTSVLFAVPTVN